MSVHPFLHYPYIGLGLLDSRSIERDGEVWTASYPDAYGKPYIKVKLEPEKVLLSEYEGRRRQAMTFHRTLDDAITLHAIDALDSERGPSRLMKRLKQHVYEPFIPQRAGFALGYAPAIAMATVHVPLELEESWYQPVPGMLAQLLHFDFAEEPDSPTPAQLVRLRVGAMRAETVEIVVRRYRVPCILLAELHYQLLYAGRDSEPFFGSREFRREMELRSFTDLEDSDRVTATFVTPPRSGGGTAVLLYQVIEQVGRADLTHRVVIVDESRARYVPAETIRDAYLREPARLSGMDLWK